MEFKVRCNHCGKETEYAPKKATGDQSPVPLPQGPKPAAQARLHRDLGALPELQGNEAIETHLAKVTHATQKIWLELYQSPDWIKSELLKSIAWLSSNPARPKKNLSRFFTNWLTRNPRPWGSFKQSQGLELTGD